MKGCKVSTREMERGDWKLENFFGKSCIVVLTLGGRRAELFSDPKSIERDVHGSSGRCRVHPVLPESRSRGVFFSNGGHLLSQRLWLEPPAGASEQKAASWGRPAPADRGQMGVSAEGQRERELW